MNKRTMRVEGDVQTVRSFVWHCEIECDEPLTQAEAKEIASLSPHNVGTNGRFVRLRLDSGRAVEVRVTVRGFDEDYRRVEPDYEDWEVREAYEVDESGEPVEDELQPA